MHKEVPWYPKVSLYIYIHMCVYVCVCVCVFKRDTTEHTATNTHHRTKDARADELTFFLFF